MASKAKQKRWRAEARRNFFRRQRYLLFVVPFLALVTIATVAYFNSRARQAQLSLVRMAQMKFGVEMNILISNGPEVERIPIQIREKLREIANLNVSGKIEFRMEPEQPRGETGLLMAADLLAPRPALAVFAPHFMELARKQDPALFRSTLLSGVIHEYVHLEHWPQKRPPTPAEQVEEESRAYSRMIIDAIRPMREAQLPVLPNYANLDDVFRNCGDSTSCPRFRDAVSGYSGLIKFPG